MAPNGRVERAVDAWRAVADELRRTLHGLDRLGDRALGAPLLVRLAFIKLRVALLEDPEPILAAVFRDEPVPEDALDSVGGWLEEQLGGGAPVRPVLEAIPPEAREDALLELREGLRRDRRLPSGLRAAAALSVAAQRWDDALAWYERLADRGAPLDTRAEALVALGDIHWRKLGESAAARGYYDRAMTLVPEDLRLVDKVLKLDLELENWAEAIMACTRLIEQLLASGEDPELTVTYRLTLGEIHLYGLREPVAALGHYLDAVAVAPGYGLTYTLLQELLEAHRWEAVEEQLGPAGEPQDVSRRVLLEHLRDAVAHHPEGAAAAVDAFRAACAGEPAHAH